MQTMGAQILGFLPDLKRYALHLARSQDRADDLVQDCVLRGLEKRDKFVQNTNLRAWLFTIMHNLFLNQVRRALLSDAYVTQASEHNTGSQPSNQFEYCLLSETTSAMDELSAEERDLIHLIGVKGISNAEVSRRTHIPIGTLKSRLFRARKKLRSRMRPEISVHQERLPRAAA